VGTAHIEANIAVNTFPQRYDSWIDSPLLGKTYNATDNAIVTAMQRLINQVSMKINE
jgi:hypothetical protein